jgi:hypothetical protein
MSPRRRTSKKSVSSKQPTEAHKPTASAARQTTAETTSATEGLPTGATADIPLDDKAVADLLNRIEERVIADRHAEIHGLFEILGSRRRLLAVNFFAGLSRGAGFFLGVTLVGGLLIGALGFFVDTTARAVGLDDVTFQSMMRVMAEKAIEAKSVWEDVKLDEARHGEPDKQPVSDPNEDANTAPPPELLPPLEDG